MESLVLLPGIELDPARVAGVEKCQKRSLLPTYSNGPSQLPGIESWKNIRSSCCLQHIQTDPADSQAFKWTQVPLFSSFTGSVLQDYQLCSLKNSMQSLKNVLDSWYCLVPLSSKVFLI